MHKQEKKEFTCKKPAAFRIVLLYFRWNCNNKYRICLFLMNWFSFFFVFSFLSVCLIVCRSSAIWTKIIRHIILNGAAMEWDKTLFSKLTKLIISMHLFFWKLTSRKLKMYFFWAVLLSFQFKCSRIVGHFHSFSSFAFNFIFCCCYCCYECETKTIEIWKYNMIYLCIVCLSILHHAPKKQQIGFLWLKRNQFKKKKNNNNFWNEGRWRTSKHWWSNPIALFELKRKRKERNFY